MLPSTARNITCDTDIKGAITLAGEDIDARALLTHAAIDRPLFMPGAGSGSPLSRGRRKFVVPSKRGYRSEMGSGPPIWLIASSKATKRSFPALGLQRQRGRWRAEGPQWRRCRRVMGHLGKNRKTTRRCGDSHQVVLPREPSSIRCMLGISEDLPQPTSWMTWPI